MSKSIYGGLMAVALNYANIASFSVPSLEFAGFISASFITGFLVTYSALFLYDHLGHIGSRFLERHFDRMLDKIFKITENKSSKKIVNNKISKDEIKIEKPKHSINTLSINK